MLYFYQVAVKVLRSHSIVADDKQRERINRVIDRFNRKSLGFTLYCILALVQGTPGVEMPPTPEYPPTVRNLHQLRALFGNGFALPPQRKLVELSENFGRVCN